jgi:agmatinase
MTIKTVRMIGLPTDANSSYLRGPAKAPARVRAVLFSQMGNAACERGAEIGREFILEDAGDLPLSGGEGDDAEIERAVSRALQDGHAPILLAGDHAVTYPVLKAIAARYGPVDILHFDAHPDLYDALDGNRRSHASPFARIMEDRLAKRLAQVGIRTLNAHQREQAARFGVEIVPMHAFSADAVPALQGPVYVSIDLDGLDPAYAPGVSHHEPGGLSVRQVLDVLWRIDAPVIGADIVEYNPDRDVHDVTAAVAAKFVKEVAALIAAP